MGQLCVQTTDPENSVRWLPQVSIAACRTPRLHGSHYTAASSPAKATHPRHPDRRCRGESITSPWRYDERHRILDVVVAATRCQYVVGPTARSCRCNRPVNATRIDGHASAARRPTATDGTFRIATCRPAPTAQWQRFQS